MNEHPAETAASRNSGSCRVVRLIWRAAAGGVGAAALAAFCVAVTAALLMVVVFTAGCAFTERIVDRTLLSSPEMRFDYLDPDRDIDDIVGIVAGGGGGGGGGC